jgi:4-amino-4-deoxy-L-arabinose transferase-like glycosyltransferase
MEATAILEREARPQTRPLFTWPMRAAFVLALAALLFFVRLGERALWSEEVRWAQIPREMISSGDYLWPTINGKTYYDKPLGSYWLVLIASWLTGEVNETSARLPSAACGLVGVLLSILIARRLYGDDAAILAGVILATSFSFVFFARTAAADIENVTGILAVLWVFLRNEHRPPGAWTVILWLLMALTSLAKGLLGFALPIVILGVYSSFAANSPQRKQGMPLLMLRACLRLIERNRWFFNRMTLFALPLAVCVYLGPFLLSMACGGSAEGLQMVYRENLQRFFDPVNHRGPIYLYAGAIFVLLAPWSLLLPAALWPTTTVGEEARRGRVFALAYFWGTFVFFTLSASRRSYYLLPILPAGAFLIASLLTQREPLVRGASLLLRTGFFLLATALFVSGVALAPLQPFFPEPWNRLPELPCPVAFAIFWLVCAGSIGFTSAKLEPRRIALCSSVIAASAMAYWYVFALPAVEIYRTQKPFAQAVKDRIGTEPNLALYRTRDIVYYLDAPGPLAEYATQEEMQNAIEAGRVTRLILRRGDWESLKLDGTVRVEEAIQPWENATHAKMKLVLVEVQAVQSAVNK